MMRIAASLLVLLSTCAAPRGTGTPGHTGDTTVVSSAPEAAAATTVPAGTCRVVATLLGLDSARTTTDTADPCFGTPCRARLKIDSIVAVGPDFPDYLVRVGDRVVATFPGTFLPHEERFNGLLVKAYPGLHPGNRFVADMALEAAPLHGVDVTTNGALTIYAYDALTP